MSEGRGSNVVHCDPSFGAVNDMAVDASGILVAVATETGVCIYTAEVLLCDTDAENMRSCPQQGRSYSFTTTLPLRTECAHAISWAPSVYYNTSALAVGYESGRVSIWRGPLEKHKTDFEEVYTTRLAASVWSIAWAPYEYGERVFVVGSADGALTAFVAMDSLWVKHTLHHPSSPAHHRRGCCCISFAPFLPSSALLATSLTASTPADITPLQLIACDRSPSIVVWKSQPQEHPEGEASSPHPPENGAVGLLPSPTIGPSWEIVGELPLPTDNPTLTFPCPPSWREVAWARNEGLPFHYAAAGSEEGFVAVWLLQEEVWRLVFVDTQETAPVTRMSWSEVGSFLLVSYANGSVRMWKESPRGEWEVVSQVPAL